MYRPNYSIPAQQKELSRQLVAEFPLGMMISNQGGKVQTSLLPFILEESDDQWTLVTHLARANPHWKILGADVLVTFQGPQGYISPAMYESRHQVPTWNYATVQMEGKPEVIFEPEKIRQILDQSVAIFENRNGTDWRMDLPENLYKKLEGAILGLKIRVTKIESKLKLSQNRDQNDWQSVLRALDGSLAPDQILLASWMRRAREPKNL